MYLLTVADCVHNVLMVSKERKRYGDHLNRNSLVGLLTSLSLPKFLIHVAILLLELINRLVN